MCTLTVVTGSDTYFMAMNRDEKIARGAGVPPEMHEFDGTKAIYPNDGDGGTWIAANEYGIGLALLNWNDLAPHGIHAKTRSRGRVIPALIDSRSLWDLHAMFSVSNFTGMLPFRLVGVFPSLGQTSREPARYGMPRRSGRIGRWFRTLAAKTPRVARGRPRAI